MQIGKAALLYGREEIPDKQRYSVQIPERRVGGSIEKCVVEFNSEPVGWLCPLVCGRVVTADRLDKTKEECTWHISKKERTKRAN